MAGATATLTDTVRDLRRRKVFRSVAAYGVVAWLLIEISSVVLPALLLPEWTVRLIVILAIAGFPIAVLLAWVFDITPDGIVRTAAAAEASTPVATPTDTGRVVDFIIIGVLLTALVFVLVRPNPVAGAAGDTRSIAVLPFADLSQARDSEYFADGVSEELLNNLVSIPGLRVAARTSSFAFKGRNEDVRNIGQQLNVDTVLEGSVRRAGDTVKISAKLIDVSDGFQLWSATYDEKLVDIFVVQEKISRAIVDALKMRLAEPATDKRMRPTTNNIEAFDLYLLGRHHWHQRTPASLARATSLFEQAIDIDPDYALAYTGLADSYLLLSGYGDLPTDEAIGKAEPLIAKALALNPDLAEAYASQGLLRWQRGDLAAAELALRGAVELNHNYAMGQMWLGGVLSEEGRLRDAFDAYQRAWELDRLHPVINANMALTLVSMGHYDEAEQYLNVVDESDPSGSRAVKGRMEMADHAGKYDRAVAIGLDAMRAAPGDAKMASMLAVSYADLGQFETAKKWLDHMASLGEADNRDTMQNRLYALLLAGDIKTVVELVDRQLERMGNWRDGSLNQKARMQLIWPGIARAVVGDYPMAVELLEQATAGEFGHGMPADRVGIMMILAHAQAKIGNAKRADIVLDNALLAAETAWLNGWSDPNLTARVALIHANRSDLPRALTLFREAADAGWSEYWFAMRTPFDEALRANPEYRKVMNQVRDRVEAMRAAAGNAGPEILREQG